jgi:hypothetical protein
MRWLLYSALVGIDIITAASCYHAMNAPSARHIDALLSGSTQITLLGLLIALAGYLRAVYVAASDARERILSGNDGLYKDEIGREKITSLQKNNYHISIASPIVLAVAVALCSRSVFESIVRALGNAPASLDVLFVSDVVLLQSVLVMLIALCIVHLRARRISDDIRTRAEALRPTVWTWETSLRDDIEPLVDAPRIRL